ncbi:HEAT repeat domain-containing protein [Vibrio nitrifigilis]|uniref:HEAT repeat domain-containing protein n=1 Tax=Vibrio nitrifigilis TaxID=2789781 RepID=A0ABS0GDA1_9VIBR|nr:HEAT repeat domain-containing protein [Vibrio nitrifigilis]MBF9000390.1 HEAT repeat domain-containing protein [Vibrio nitrifigilis]
MVLIKQDKPLMVDDALEDVQLSPLTTIDDIRPRLLSNDADTVTEALHDLDIFDSDAILPLIDDIVHLINQEGASHLGEVAFSSLQTHLSDQVVQKLVHFLASEDPFIRNQAIELLQNSPELLAPYIGDLIHSDNNDVRIFSVDILGLLPHPDVPVWIKEILRTESHVNVVGAAIDRATQLADPSLVPELKQVKQRFNDVAYIQFACDLAITRLAS